MLFDEKRYMPNNQSSLFININNVLWWKRKAQKLTCYILKLKMFKNFNKKNYLTMCLKQLKLV